LPALRVVDNRVLVARYDLTLAPHQIITLYHAAAQRPLKAYPTFAEALSSWDLSALFSSSTSMKKLTPKNWPAQAAK
jgi:hypothetical protein